MKKERQNLYKQMLEEQSAKYPFLPPTPWSNGNTGAPDASSTLGALAANQSCFLPGQSHLQYPSPVSPMMYLNSPYMSSIPSVNPSVSSSSGCSSSSDGSVASLNHSYALSEYHVGPRRPLIEKITDELDNQNESPSNSGRSTLIDVRREDSVVLSSECFVYCLGSKYLRQYRV